MCTSFGPDSEKKRSSRSFRASNGAQFIFNFNFQSAAEGSSASASASSRNFSSSKNQGPVFCFNFNNIPDGSTFPQMLSFNADMESPSSDNSVKTVPVKQSKSERPSTQSDSSSNSLGNVPAFSSGFSLATASSKTEQSGSTSSFTFKTSQPIAGLAQHSTPASTQSSASTSGIRVEASGARESGSATPAKVASTAASSARPWEVMGIKEVEKPAWLATAVGGPAASGSPSTSSASPATAKIPAFAGGSAKLPASAPLSSAASVIAQADKTALPGDDDDDDDDAQEGKDLFGFEPLERSPGDDYSHVFRYEKIVLFGFVRSMYRHPLCHLCNSRSNHFLLSARISSCAYARARHRACMDR